MSLWFCDVYPYCDYDGVTDGFAKKLKSRRGDTALPPSEITYRNTRGNLEEYLI
jgi:hypothetical protein